LGSTGETAILSKEAALTLRPRTARSRPAPEPPLQRLLAQGPQSLSDAELLALLIGEGGAGISALPLARAALSQLGGLAGVLNASRGHFEAVAGLGARRHARAQAALEIAKRMLRQELVRGPVLNAPARVRDYLRLSFGRIGHEVFTVLFLDAQQRLIACEELFRGTLTQTSVYPREVVRRALALNCAAVILSHNHPSGIAEPSRADQVLTRELQNALKLVDVQVLDHIIVAATASVSFAELGLL
jgi:DNA repair protein RadC